MCAGTELAYQLKGISHLWVGAVGDLLVTSFFALVESLETFQGLKDVRVTVYDSKAESSDDSHVAHLLQISRILNDQIFTTDDNLTKVARLQGIDVLNLNDINDALKLKVEVGSRLSFSLVRTGKEDHQGVGYLPDGSMIVVNNAVSKIGSSQRVSVISIINTSADLMVLQILMNLLVSNTVRLYTLCLNLA